MYHDLDTYEFIQAKHAKEWNSRVGGREDRCLILATWYAVLPKDTGAAWDSLNLRLTTTISLL